MTSVPPSRRSRIWSPDQTLELRLQFPPPLPDHEAQRGNRVHRGRNGHDQLPRKLDFVARPRRQKLARQPPAIELAIELQDLLHGIDRGLGQVDHRRVHLHHPPPGNIDRQVDDVVHVRVRDKPRRRAHERPGLGAEIEAQLELRDPPIRLHGSPRIALDRQVLVGERFHGQVIDHRQCARSYRSREVQGCGRLLPGRIQISPNRSFCSARTR